jgi:hypothetical protein
MLASARIMQKISLARTGSQCDTGVIQEGLIRRHSKTVKRDILLSG